MHQRTSISVPCHWNSAILDEIIAQNNSQKDIFIDEMYGVPSKGHIASGRCADQTIRITNADAIAFNQKIHANGLRFNFLLNAPVPTTMKDASQTDAYLDWIIHDFKADSLTITSYSLMKSVKERYPQIPIRVSTIAGILTKEELKQYIHLHPQRVVLHHDANRNWSDLAQIITQATQEGIAVELMTTESCLRRCPWRTQHYADLGRGLSDKCYHQNCNSLKISSPYEILKANIIRPEDVSVYESIGINHFKITGRSKNASWLPEVTRAYLERTYRGNLIRLTGIDPRLCAENFMYLENAALDGFLRNYPSDQKSETRYCNDWIIRLWKDGLFKITGAQFQIDPDGILRCKEFPKQLEVTYGKKA